MVSMYSCLGRLTALSVSQATSSAFADLCRLCMRMAISFLPPRLPSVPPHPHPLIKPPFPQTLSHSAPLCAPPLLFSAAQKPLLSFCPFLPYQLFLHIRMGTCVRRLFASKALPPSPSRPSSPGWFPVTWLLASKPFVFSNLLHLMCRLRG